MRPAELKREIERLTVDASLTRSTLGSLRERLASALGIVADMRAALGLPAPEASTARSAADAEGTPQGARVQGDAGRA